MEQLEKFFESIFLKKTLYQLPTKAKELIVSIAPWVIIVMLVFSLPTVFGLLGFGSVLPGVSALGIKLGARYYFGLLVLLLQLILMGIAAPSLIKRQLKGWRLVYYANLISFVFALVSAYAFGNILWAIVTLAISMYIIFQVKSYYR